jgi:precorrin-2 dehydrogenase/sirohydrochlorin ferrochelatase
MRLFPLFLKLRGRRCLIVGGGEISEGKIAGLLSTGAKIQVVSPEVTPQIAAWHRGRQLRWMKRKFRQADLRGVYVVIAATSSNAVHLAIYREAQKRGILCNIVDVPELCDFYYGSVVQRGDLQIAISTAGASPSLAKRLRKKFEDEFGADYAEWLKALARERNKIRRTSAAAGEKMRLLEELASEAAFLEYRRQAKGKKRTD